MESRPKLFPFHPDLKPDGTSKNEIQRQFVDIPQDTRWFDTLVITALPEGLSDGMRTFPDSVEDEVWYYITEGKAEFVQPDGKVEEILPFDAVFFTPGCGGELRAPASNAVKFLTLVSCGGKPTVFSKSSNRGAATLAKGAGKPATIFHRHYIAPRQWPANTLGATAKPWWFYTVVDTSRWFHSGCVSCVPPGGASTFHTHMEKYEGPYETFYIAFQGTALIRGEYEDYLFPDTPGGVYVPTDAAHQIINNGTGLLWYLTISSRGNTPLKVDVYNMPSGAERPGYLEEYNRILAARAARGLPLY